MIGSIIYYNKQLKKKSIHEAVKIDVQYDIQNCPKSYPVRIVVKNNSDKIIHKVEWSMSAHKPGYSNNIAQHMHPEVHRILTKGDSYEMCYRLPKFKEFFPPEAAIYGAEYKHIKLADGDRIYQSDASLWW